MRKIAHRGNYKGTGTARENSYEYLDEALAAGYDVEIDIWSINGDWWLGHDLPTYKLVEHQMRMLFYFHASNCWFHAKNFEALERLAPNGLNVFCHESDKYHLTTEKFIWTADTSVEGNNVIHMISPSATSNFEVQRSSTKRITGICCDDFSIL